MGILDYIKDMAKSGINNFLKGIEKEVTSLIMKKIKYFQRYLMKSFISVSIMLIGIVFIAISLSFLLMDYLHVSRTVSFAILGIFLILIGVIIKVMK